MQEKPIESRKVFYFASADTAIFQDYFTCFVPFRQAFFQK